MTIPGYNQNIPRVTDDLATSQRDFLKNFEKMNEAFSANHIALTALSLLGNHTVIELLEAPQRFETGTGQLSIYSKDVSGQTDQLFLRYQGDGTEVQLTNYQLYSFANANSRFQFFTFLPGKILFYFGFVDIPGYPFVLNLNPAIAKNIITMNFCPGILFGTTSSYPPRVEIVAPVNGIISQLILQSPFAGPPFSETQFYLIMANI